ncbi:Zinc finger protein 622 [Chionoecetes opilio]|uniref:Zinc finger protein 622 n=1 Tax=Chionoecetes opilio TaxID=41210 RepID=A0A8J4YMP8_CHIOP|nr:Zinc finger protein 622 [Chionoecetes opilio]
MHPERAPQQRLSVVLSGCRASAQRWTLEVPNAGLCKWSAWKCPTLDSASGRPGSAQCWTLQVVGLEVPNAGSAQRWTLQVVGLIVPNAGLCKWSVRKCPRLDSVRKHMNERQGAKQGGAGEGVSWDMLSFMITLPLTLMQEAASGDDEVKQTGLSGNSYQEVLPSGATVAHRSLPRYYWQKLEPKCNAVVVKKQPCMAFHSLMAKCRALGWTGATKTDVESKMFLKEVLRNLFVSVCAKTRPLSKNAVSFFLRETIRVSHLTLGEDALPSLRPHASSPSSHTLGDALRITSMGQYRSDSSPQPWIRKKSRVLDVTLTRLRLGHTTLTAHLHHLRLSPDPHCPWCMNFPETIEHFLLQCPHFHLHRVVLHSQLLALNVTTFDLPTLLAAAGVPPSRQHPVIRLTCAFLRKTGQLPRL